MRQDNEKGVDYEGRHYTMYQATQRQRQFERSIRKQKRRILVAEQNPGDKERLQQAQIKYQVLDQEYKRFSKAAGLRLQHERMEMAGFGPKRVRAAEKTLENKLRYDKMISEIKAAGNFSQNAKIHVPATALDPNGYSFDDVHINSERQHGVSIELAKSWISGARMSATVWNGKFERFYGTDGAAYVDLIEKQIRTAFSSAEFDDKTKAILEVLKQYGY